jgi:hypothetical protein
MKKRGFRFKYKKKNKAQIQNQVFVFMLAAIVFSLVFLFGYKAIGDILKNAEYVSHVKFKNEIESTFKKIAPTQNVMKKDFVLPSGHDRICFFDRGEDIDNNDLCGNNKVHTTSVLCDAWKDNGNVSNNVYLSPMGPFSFKTPRVQMISDLDIIQPVYCYNATRGRITLKLIGKGNRVIIEQVN